jgi:hypothetical protein
MELIVCFGIFSLLSLVALGILVFGSQGFHRVIYEQGSQSDLRRIMASLQRDFQSTHHRSISLIDRDSASGYQRDGICLASLDNWNDPGNFDEYLRPRWNRYVVYYATLEQNGKNEAGRLIREVVQPSGAPVGPFEFSTFLASPGYFLEEGTPLQTSSVESQVLSDRLWKFELGNDLVAQSVSLRLALRNPPQPNATGIERDMHTMEVLQEIKPANTWPQI